MNEQASQSPQKNVGAPFLASPRSRCVAAALCLVLIVAAVVICVVLGLDKGHGRSTVEGPGSAIGYVLYNNRTTYYSLLKWRKPSQTVLIFDDIHGAYRGRDGHSSTEIDYDITNWYAGNSEYDITYKIRIITWRNGTIVFSIEDDPYNLTQGGGLFLIKTANGGVQVQQVFADLSGIDFGRFLESVQAFVETSDDVISFLYELD